MKISMNTATLCSALRTLQKITPAKAVLPILSHVLIRAEGNAALLSCTDTEISMTRSCTAVVSAAGEVALPVKPLLDVVQEITEPDVHLFAENSGTRIAAGAFKLRLQSSDGQHFPNIALQESSGELLNGAIFRSIIRKVRPCISETEKRYNINGALLVFSEKVIALVATDGKRLAVATTPRTAGTSNGVTQIVIPTKTLDTLIQDDSDDYSFTATDRQMFFVSENSVLSSRMIDSKFPNYQRSIPSSNPHAFTVTRDSLSAALKRVSLASGEQRVVNCSLSANMLQLQAKSLEIGDAVENVAVEYAGDDTQVNLQSAAMLDFLDAAENTKVSIAFGGPTSSVLMSDGSNFIKVAMAVRA